MFKPRIQYPSIAYRHKCNDQVINNWTIALFINTGCQLFPITLDVLSIYHSRNY